MIPASFDIVNYGSVTIIHKLQGRAIKQSWKDLHLVTTDLNTYQLEVDAMMSHPVKGISDVKNDEVSAFTSTKRVVLQSW